MQCPFCLSDNLTVLDSRDSDNGQAIRRRRSCEVCRRRFTTYERVDMRLPKVIKRDDSREDFDGLKVRRSMEIALRKRREVDVDDIDKAISSIIQQALSIEDKEIPSRRIGEWIMQVLYHLDAVAFVRYASVYQDFKSVEDFNMALQGYFDPAPTLPTMVDEECPLIHSISAKD